MMKKWHAPIESKNSEPIKFSKLIFEKSDLKKDLNNSQKHSLVSGN